MAIFVGTAGWSIRREHTSLFGPGPNRLARYASRFNAVEINSSFYKPHRAATYARWAASVPAGFRFAVKVPRAITHNARLIDTDAAIAVFLEQACSLDEKLGPLLIQLPPSLAYDARVAGRFLESLRARFGGAAVCEPRHVSWFGPDADSLLASFKIARAAADPAPASGAEEPGGWEGLRYFRWHGSPVMYRSEYSTPALASVAARMKDSDACWCIFDNTAEGAATPNALALAAMFPGHDRRVSKTSR
jgi:uncharacterized protein YecE (DUF72 family)